MGEKEAANRSSIKQVIVAGNCSSVSLRNCEKQSRLHLRIISKVRKVNHLSILINHWLKAAGGSGELLIGRSKKAQRQSQLLSLSVFKNCFSIKLCQFCPLCPPPTHHTPTPTVNPHTVVHAHGSFIHVLWLVPSPSFHHHPPLLPASHCQSVTRFMPVVLFCSLGSSYRWDHIVFVFHWLAYFP